MAGWDKYVLKYDLRHYQGGRASVADLWREHSHRVIAEWVAEHPGTRPILNIPPLSHGKTANRKPHTLNGMACFCRGAEAIDEAGFRTGSGCLGLGREVTGLRPFVDSTSTLST